AGRAARRARRRRHRSARPARHSRGARFRRTLRMTLPHRTMTRLLSRRLALAALAALAGCSSAPLRIGSGPAPDPYPPIVFVHGNGDTAAVWMTTIWRFESNGWPRERLHAIDLP